MQPAQQTPIAPPILARSLALPSDKLLNSDPIPWSSSPPDTRIRAPLRIKLPPSGPTSTPSAQPKGTLLTSSSSASDHPPSPPHPPILRVASRSSGPASPRASRRPSLSPRAKRKLAVLGPDASSTTRPRPLTAGTGQTPHRPLAAPSTSVQVGALTVCSSDVFYSVTGAKARLPTSTRPKLATALPIPPALSLVKPSTPLSSEVSIEARVVLSPEQLRVLDLVLGGTSIFFTGSAGTGKSVLLRTIIRSLRARHVARPAAVVVTASTGIAACNVGGSTIHSFAGIGLGDKPVNEHLKVIRRNKTILARWKAAKVWIIDEVSMLGGELIDKLDQIGQAIRKSSEPFGGIQIIATGDFFQLPPVTRGSAGPTFAFEAACWSRTIERTVTLSQVFRQKDQTFVTLLNHMRLGQVSAPATAHLKSLSRVVRYPDGIEPTELYPRREDVERANKTRLGLLKTDEQQYTAKDSGRLPLAERSKALSHMLATEFLTLKVSAQVMLIKNVDEQLVNGSIGVVVSFSDPLARVASLSTGDEVSGDAPRGQPDVLYPVVRFAVPGGKGREVLVVPHDFKVEDAAGRVVASRNQLPLVLSWAMSIHKSQGQTIQRVKVDLARIFENGQAYVALSRATSLDALQVLNFDPNKVRCHPKVMQWSKSLEVIA